MSNLLNDFLASPLHIKGLLILWGVCVVSFYSSVVYIMGTIFFNRVKKVYND
jgi:hypothetical protein